MAQTIVRRTLIGLPGPAGPPGVQGPTGATGATGPQGSVGEIATEAEAIAGVEDFAYMTPLRTSDAMHGLELTVRAGSNVTRTLPDYLRDEIHLEDEPNGIVFDDDGADNEPFRSLMEEAANDGRKIVGGYEKTLWLPEWADGLVDASIEKTLHMDFAPGFTIAGAGTVGPVLRIDGDAFKPQLIIKNLTIDNSLRDGSLSADGGTGLSLKRLSRVETHNLRVVAAAHDGSFDVAGMTGDNGVGMQEVDGSINYNFQAENQLDQGAYITGGASAASATDDGWDHYFYAPIVKRCRGGISLRRAGHRLGIFGGATIECMTGHWTAEVGQSGGIPSGYEMIVSGHFFKKCVSRMIHPRQYGRMIATGCLFEDWGKYPDGTDETVFIYAIHHTAPNCAYTGNIFRFADYSGVGKQGIRAHFVTLAGTLGTSYGSDSVIEGNLFDNMEFGYVESNPSAIRNHGANHYMPNVTTPVTLTTNSPSQMFNSAESDGAEDERPGTGDITIPVEGKAIQRYTGTLPTNRTVTQTTTALRIGTRRRHVRTGAGAFTLTIDGLKALSTNQWCETIWNGTNVVLIGYGSL